MVSTTHHCLKVVSMGQLWEQGRQAEPHTRMGKEWGASSQSPGPAYRSASGRVLLMASPNTYIALFL